MTALRLVTESDPAPRARRFHAIGSRVVTDWAHDVPLHTIPGILARWTDAMQAAFDAGDWAMARTYVRPCQDLTAAWVQARLWAAATSPFHRRTA